MRVLLWIAICFGLTGGLAGPAAADPFAVHDAATGTFDSLPAVEIATDMGRVCGAGAVTNAHIGYCTTENIIYVSQIFAARPFAAYEMGHVLGHAIQVRHGVADVALREITRRRDEEAALRGMVTRQVECIAGVLSARAGLPRADLRAMTAEPFTEAHWGRRPLNMGPRVSIGLDARATWYDLGYAANDFSACTVGEMSAELIVAAERVASLRLR